MNDAEKEAEEIYKKSISQIDKSWRELVAQALQKKQDEIERLTARNKELEEEINRIKEVADNKDSMLTVHILRTWERDKLERFCFHLLGDKYQDRIKELESKLAKTRELARNIEDELIKMAHSQKLITSDTSVKLNQIAMKLHIAQQSLAEGKGEV